MNENTEKITGVLVDPSKSKSAKKVTIRKSLSGYYEAIGCNCIDIVTRRIGGRTFAVVCDDEGLLNEGSMISSISYNFVPDLVGKIFICKESGVDLSDLNNEEIQIVLDNIITLTDADGKSHGVVLID